MSSPFPRNLRQLMGTARRLKNALSPLMRSSSGTTKSRQQSRGRSPQNSANCTADQHLGRAYPGDFTGSAQLEYSPKADGKPDPGEIVWTWVPYEEDHCQGKDRPVLLVGRNGKYLLAAMLTTRDRNNTHEHDPNYLDIGTGPWDRKRRPSEVKLDRILQIHPDDVRRNGAILDEQRFRFVQERLEQNHGWYH
ncbi:type II toxin-antitoxin system PemK/MazF family toxin [Micrococcoides hystricis]|uniref:Type II toxin-antitoxin system PemK/MazF family toxin n=1 Tax=Micrococcoides hystricis TaxID=1572761 RepID=A0ABV6P8A8_9MICC